MDFTTRLLQSMDPETAHKLSIKALSAGLHPRLKNDSESILATKLMGLDFPNPFAIAAGFDKNGQAISACHKMGLGFVEIGSVTPKPQAGSPKPRVFRLKDQQAVINRYGFNSDGHAAVACRLAKWRENQSGILGVNLGKNKETENAVDDYVLGAKALGQYADYIVVNVSSPNTPGLRGEQSPERLRPLLSEMKTALAGQVPLVLKVAPDLTEQDVEDMSAIAIEVNLDALIVSNTTLKRPLGCDIGESGGLSGRPLFEASTQMLRTFAVALDGKVPLIGVGGVASAEDAYTKIRNGASLVQVYSALTYQGHGLIGDLLTGVADLLRQDGFTRLDEAVGADLA